MIVKVYKNGKKTKSKYLISPEGRCCSSNSEIVEAMKLNPELDIKFIDVNNDQEDITYNSLILILKTNQDESIGPGEDLTRVIKAGGFVKYIEQLERKISEKTLS